MGFGAVLNALYLYRKSEWGKELLYSIRSVERYLKPDRILVVGDKPNISVECIETKPKERYKDVMYNLSLALSDIEGEWVLMHDDFFLLEPYNPILRYKGTLKNRVKGTGGNRKPVLQNVLSQLPDAKNYSLHYPLPFNADIMQELFNIFEQPFSYMNAYGNLDNNFVHLEADDCKFSAPLINEKFLKGLPSFSTYNEDDRFEGLLQKLYPQPSQYE